MPKSNVTTIQVDRSVVDALNKLKRYRSETYSEVILNLIKNIQETRELETFVQKAQEIKMKESWQEEDYSGWELA